MKKLSFVFAMACAFNAQSQVYEEHDIVFRTTYGFINPLQKSLEIELNSVDVDETFGPLVVEGEYLLFEDFSVGASYSYNELDFNWNTVEFDYSDYNNPQTYVYQNELFVKNQSFFATATAHFSGLSFSPAGGRGGTHNVGGSHYDYSAMERLDLYVTAGLGYRKLDFDFRSTKPAAVEPDIEKRSPFRVLVNLGMNVYIIPNLAWNINMCFSHSSMFRTGLTIRLNPKG